MSVVNEGCPMHPISCHSFLTDNILFKGFRGFWLVQLFWRMFLFLTWLLPYMLEELMKLFIQDIYTFRDRLRVGDRWKL
jgi:hypothetical protein